MPIPTTKPKSGATSSSNPSIQLIAEPIPTSERTVSGAATVQVKSENQRGDFEGDTSEVYRYSGLGEKKPESVMQFLDEAGVPPEMGVKDFEALIFTAMGKK